MDDQELSWLALVQAVELVVETVLIFRSGKFDGITLNQWKLIEWLDL